MKALSIRQPWAELILQGRRTLELRTWRTTYRGKIAVHAAQEIDKTACEHYGIDAQTLPRGQIVGTVEIGDIIDFDAESFDAAQVEHLYLKGFPGDLVGWRLTDPQRLSEPINFKGKYNLFEIPDALMETVLLTVPPSTVSATDTTPKPIVRPISPSKAVTRKNESGCPFEIYLHPAASEPPYVLVLTHWQSKQASIDGSQAQDKPTEVSRLEGLPLRLVSDAVLDALRHSGYKVTDLSVSRRTPFQVEEEIGIRLGLLFLSVRPLTRPDRIDKIIAGLHAMPSEEAYYWYSKCTALATEVNAVRALRMLLAGE